MTLWERVRRGGGRGSSCAARGSGAKEEKVEVLERGGAPVPLAVGGSEMRRGTTADLMVSSM